MKIKKYIKKALDNAYNISDKNVVFISDCHLGCKDAADEAASNQHLIFHALCRYYELGYVVVLLGDTFELAEQHDIEKIKDAHSHIMWILSVLYENNQLIIVKGNHDYKLSPNLLATRTSPYNGDKISFIDSPVVCDAITCGKLIAMHGNQYFVRYSSFINKILVWLGPIWRAIQTVLGGYYSSEHTGWQDAIKCQEYFSDLGGELDRHFIIGHTHKMSFSLPRMTDCGSFGCIPRCITAVEYKSEDNTLSSIKWTSIVSRDGTVKVVRELLGRQDIL